jgi:hypothetical protein
MASALANRRAGSGATHFATTCFQTRGSSSSFRRQSRSTMLTAIVTVVPSAVAERGGEGGGCRDPAVALAVHAGAFPVNMAWKTMPSA